MSRRRRKTYRIKVLSPRPDQSRHGCTYVWVDSYLAFSREIINKLLDLLQSRGDAKVYIMNDGVTLKHIR